MQPFTAMSELFFSLVQVTLKPAQALLAHFNLYPMSTPLESSAGVEHQSHYVVPQHVKKLPTFDCNSIHWPLFRDLMESLVGNNPTLPDIYKLWLLAEAVPDRSKYLSCYGTYQKAMDTLKREFEEPDRVYYDVMKLVAELPKLGHPVTVQEWRNFQTVLLCCERIAENHDSYFKWKIIYRLKMKLGDYYYYLYNCEKDDFSEFAQCVSRWLRGAEKDEERDIWDANRTGKAMPNKTNNTREPEPCYFCNEQHLRKDCPLTKQERKRALRLTNRCFKCLAYRDVGHSCSVLCRRCKAPAHSLICPCLSSGDDSKDISL